MYCPDCGRKIKLRERFCSECGYPVSALKQCIEKEKESALGWAEKIVGKPKIDIVPPKEPPLTSFATGREEPKVATVKSGRICERCGSDVLLETSCPECGDRLPAIFENDPFIGITIRSLFQMIVRPAEFAQNLPYPVRGGTIQPLLYPAVVSALLVLTLPLGRPEFWVSAIDLSSVYVPIVLAFLTSLVITPLLIYLSAWTVNLVGALLESRGQLRRTIRVMGAIVFWFIAFGVIFNLLLWAFFAAHANPRVSVSLIHDFDLRASVGTITRLLQFIDALYLLGFGFIFGFAFSGLYRLNRIKALILTISTYGALMPLWLYIIVLIPLHLAGLI